MIKVFEAFAGIGTQRMALERLGIEHEVVAIAEIDKYAIKSYEAIHGEVSNLGDISKIKTEDIPDHDLFTYSFPCQDISLYGKGLGLDAGSGTRSGLLWECQKIIAGKKPKYLLLENVKNLVGKKHKHNFELWLDWLSEQGYKNYWKVLNAKDYGIPQNRERVFCVSILGEHTPYEFPEKEELKTEFRDCLTSSPRYLDERDYRKVYGLGATYRFGGYVAPDNKTEYGTITARYGAVSGNSMKFKDQGGYRYLSPQECWRLMGIHDSAFDKAQASGVSEAQLYKQAGNAIVVDVLEAIFRNLFSKKQNKG